MKLSQSIMGKLPELAKQKPNLFSELETTVSEKDYLLMSKACFELLELAKQPEIQALLLKGKPDTAQYNPGNLSAMIGIDFHITEEGPRVIEINTNAGGLVTSALWAYRDDQARLETVLKKMVAMFEAEFGQWRAARGVEAELKHIAIIDKDPESEFTYDDFLLMAAIFEQAGYRVSIGKTEGLSISDGKVYLSGSSQAVDLIYNRDCDFYLQSKGSAVLRQSYLEGLACVSPNAFGYGLLSDKMNLATISQLLHGQAENDYPALTEVLLPTMTLASFLEQELNRNDWYFKPTNEHAGKGVYRGKKLSQKRLSEFPVSDYIVQKEALPAQISNEGDSFKYDIRLFIYDDDVIDIYSRIYQGRITNFRSEKGGYSRVSVVANG